MKIAALADIHSNYRALTAVLEDLADWQPDLVYILGDTINRGPRPQDCLQLIQELEARSGWKIILGNHEKYVLDFASPESIPIGPERQIRRIIHWTFQMLSQGEISYLQHLPAEINDVPFPDQDIRAVHASMLGLRKGIYPETSPAELRKLIHPPPVLMLVGHTHQPLIRRFNRTTIVNAGSIGLPFDGDSRTGYARLALIRGKWKAQIIRLTYDIKEAERDFERENFISAGGPLAEVVLQELRTARPQLSHWLHRYRDEVIQGNLSLREATDRFLENPNLTSPR